MAFRNAGSGGGGPLPGSMGFGTGARGGGGASSTTTGPGGMPGFPALSSQGAQQQQPARPLSNQSGAFMGIGRGGGPMGSFGINGLGGPGYGSHAPPTSSQAQQSEASLDPSDFPALGGGGGAGSIGGSVVGSGGAGPGAPSYASHVNTPSVSSNGPSSAGGPLAAGLGQGASAAIGGQRTDFTADDFPALDGGGHEAVMDTRDQVGVAAAAFNAQMARMPGGKTSGPTGADKRNYATKLGGPNAFPGPAHLMNGVTPTSQQQSLLQAQAHAAQSAAVFRSAGPHPPPAPSSEPALDGNGTHHPPRPHASSTGGGGVLGPVVPQTPAQQVLYSPADRFGLLGLLQIIKHADPDMSKLTLGMDLTQLGLDVASGGNLYSTFMTPWSDPSQVAAANVEPEFHLPSCYNVSPPAIQTKIGSFHDESLLWIFYNQPRDVLQEMAATELYKRNWRYHKELQTWLTKQAGVEPHEKNNSFEKGEYIFFDTKEWRKVSREYTLVYASLEAKPSFMNPAILSQAIATLPVPVHPGSASQPSSAPGVVAQLPGVSQQVPGRTASAQGGAPQPRVPSGVAA